MSAPHDDQQLLSIGQVAERLGVKPQYVYQLRSRKAVTGFPPALVDNGKLLFASTDIDAFIAERAARAGRRARGRRPRAYVAAGSGEVSFADQIRAAIASGAGDHAGIRTQRDLAAKLNFDTSNLNRRFSGEYSWKPDELELIRSTLGVEPRTDGAS